jgi:putative SOS response-associated peptidase YedK
MRRFVQSFTADDGFPMGFPSALKDALADAPDRYNIGVRKPASAIVLEEAGPAVREFQWGLIPRWSKTPDTPYTTVTARLERAAGSRLFKQAWESRHCVIPSTAITSGIVRRNRPRLTSCRLETDMR